MRKLNRRSVLANSAAAIAVAGFGVGSANAGSTEHTIIIEKFKFVPDSLEVKVGDTITWINKDIIEHTATADEGDWTTEGLDKDQSETLTVTADMTESYFCAYHVHMKATLKIVA